MDLSIPIIGVIAFLGYSLNETKTPREIPNKRKKISPHETPSGKNIYHSTFSKEIDVKERQIADIQFKKSRFPKKTNIIPPLYNTECSWGCDKKISEYTITPSESKIINDKILKKKNTNSKKTIINGPMFNSQLHGFSITVEEPVSVDMDKRENFDPTISQLTGLPLDLSHDNMVPFFGSNVTQNTDLNSRNSILDNHTGETFTKIKKQETVQLFEPEKQQVFGTKTFGDLIDSDRYIPSRFHSNVKPIPDIKVQPLPETVVRPGYKSVDNLRVINKPKVEYEKPMTSGKKFITERGIQPRVFKNRPETAYNNDKLFTTTGQEKAPRSRENFSETKMGIKNVIAETSLNLTPGSDLKKSGSSQRYTKNVNSDVQFSLDLNNRKQEVEQDWVRNAGSNNYDPLDDFINRESYFAPEQERETTSRMNLLPAKTSVPDTYTGLGNLPKTTNKEMNLFSYKGAGSRTTIGNVDTTQYDNIQIRTNREDIINKRGYVAGKNSINNTDIGDIGGVLKRDDSLRNNLFNPFSNKNSPSAEGLSINLFGESTQDKQQKCDFSIRNTDPDLVKTLKNNPLANEYSVS